MEEFATIIAATTTATTALAVLLLFIPKGGAEFYSLSGVGQFLWMVFHLFSENYTAGIWQATLYLLVGAVIISLVRAIVQALLMALFGGLLAAGSALEKAIKHRR